MPLVSDRPGVGVIRERLLNVAMDKYLFQFHGNARPIDKIVESGRVRGLRFIKTETREGKVHDLAGTEFEVHAPLVISSIGSIPEPIAGIPMKGELYVWRDWDRGELNWESPVHGLGNVITGKGNIVVSRKHAQEIGKIILAKLKTLPSLAEEQYQRLMGKVRARQQAVGYDGNYASWTQTCDRP